MKRWVPVLALLATVLGVWAATVRPCGLEYTFRAYLDKRFWQPLSKYEESLGRSPTVESPNKGVPFAGISNGGSNEILQTARDAYVAGRFSDAGTAVETCLKTNPPDNEREELLLIDAKIDLREWKEHAPNCGTGTRKHMVVRRPIPLSLQIWNCCTGRGLN